MFPCGYVFAPTFRQIKPRGRSVCHKQEKKMDVVVLERAFCMLHSFDAVQCVSKEWNEVVKKLQTDWWAHPYTRSLDAPPNATPSPRLCARVLRFQIDERFLVPGMRAHPRAAPQTATHRGSYTPTSPAYEPGGGSDTPTSPAYAT